MIYQIAISERADADMTEIGLYIARELHSPQTADKLLDEFDKHILSLEQMPKRYALVDDKRLALLGIRKIPVKNYLVFYNIDESCDKVHIVRVLHGMRDWMNML